MRQSAIGRKARHSGLDNGASATIAARAVTAHPRSTGSDTAKRHGRGGIHCKLQIAPSTLRNLETPLRGMGAAPRPRRRPHRLRPTAFATSVVPAGGAAGSPSRRQRRAQRRAPDRSAKTTALLRGRCQVVRRAAPRFPLPARLDTVPVVRTTKRCATPTRRQMLIKNLACVQPRRRQHFGRRPRNSGPPSVTTVGSMPDD